MLSRTQAERVDYLVNMALCYVAKTEAMDRIINGGIVEGFSDRQGQSLSQNLAQTVAGLRLYKIDEARSLASYFYQLEREEGRTKALLRRALRTRDEADIPLLEGRLRKLATTGDLTW